MGKLKQTAALGIVFLIFLLGGLAQAASFRTGDKVTIITGTLEDDLYVATETLAIGGRVNGEVLGAARRITLAGSTAGSVGLAAETVSIDGSVEGTARLAARTLELSGAVARDALLFGQTIRVDDAATVGRDLILGGENARIAGKVGRNLQGGVSRLVVTGEVTGDVKVQADEVELGPGARIGGDLVYTSEERANIADGAVVTGRIRRLTPEPEDRRGPVEVIVGQLQSMLGPILLGLLLLWLIPRLLPLLDSVMRGSPGAIFGAGAAVLFLVPMAAVILFVIFAILGGGWGLLGVLLAAYSVALLLTRVVAGYALGRYILRRVDRFPDEASFAQRAGALAVGVILLTIVMAIPALGITVRFIAMLFTLGALLISLLRRRGGQVPPDGGSGLSPVTPESAAATPV